MEAAPEKKLAWFERLSGTWHLRVDSDDPWGRYLECNNCPAVKLWASLPSSAELG